MKKKFADEDPSGLKYIWSNFVDFFLDRSEQFIHVFSVYIEIHIRTIEHVTLNVDYLKYVCKT